MRSASTVMLKESPNLPSSMKTRRKLAIAVLIFIDIGIHQVQGHSAKIDSPDDDKNTQAADIQFNQNTFFVVRTGGFDWSLTAFEQFINIFLPAVRLNSLMK